MNAEPLKDLAFPLEKLKQRVVERVKTEESSAQGKAREAEHSFLEHFQQAPDAQRVQAYIMKYQTEWHLWTVLLKDFSCSDLQYAYISQAVLEGKVAEACQRYRSHSKAMGRLREEKWQATVAEVMLERLESIALVRAQAESKPVLKLPEIFYTFVMGSKLVGMGWVFLGLFLTLKLLGAI